MRQEKVTVINKLGLHARPSALVVEKARIFKSKIIFTKDGLSVDAKEIMNLLQLAAEKGSVIDIRVEGPDEEQALREIQRLFTDGFSEAYGD